MKFSLSLIGVSGLDITIIIPVHNEEKNINELHNKIKSILISRDLKYEIIFIDDGSTDNTFEQINNIKDENIRIIQFRRNFGKSAALDCGFKEAKGNYVITMDGDLQDEPNEIPKFIEELKKYDMVSGWKYNRQDPLSKTFPSKIFNRLTRFLTGVNIHDFNCGYKGYNNYMLEDIKVYGELHRYIPALAFWKGYSVSEIKVEHHPRVNGKSKYGIERLLKGFLDLITITFLMNYLKRPLHIFGSTGLILNLFGIVTCVYLASLWLSGTTIGDRPLLLLGILLLVTGTQFISIGLIGELLINSKDHDDYAIKYDTKKQEDLD